MYRNICLRCHNTCICILSLIRSESVDIFIITEQISHELKQSGTFHSPNETNIGRSARIFRSDILENYDSFTEVFLFVTFPSMAINNDSVDAKYDTESDHK
jgi:hypothetical protein